MSIATDTTSQLKTGCVHSFAFVWNSQPIKNATIIETIERFVQSKLPETASVLNWFITRTDAEDYHVEGNYLSQ